MRVTRCDKGGRCGARPGVPDNRHYRSAESAREPPDGPACNAPQAANYTMVEASNGAVLDVIYETGERLEAAASKLPTGVIPAVSMRAGR